MQWIVAVNNDPQSSDYLSNNLLADLKSQVLNKIIPTDVDSSVFSLLTEQEYTTLIQSFQNVIPESNGSSYIALRSLATDQYLADPLVLYNALLKQNDNIYASLGIQSNAQDLKSKQYLKE